MLQKLFDLFIGHHPFGGPVYPSEQNDKPLSCAITKHVVELKIEEQRFSSWVGVYHALDSLKIAASTKGLLSLRRCKLGTLEGNQSPGLLMLNRRLPWV